MLRFEELYATAILHKGGREQVEASLPSVLSASELAAITDDRLLSQMSRRIFRAGLKHSMVDARWPAFEEAFQGFDVRQTAMMSDDEMDGLMGNESIIRHRGKLMAVRKNATWMLQVAQSEGSFAGWLAAWPEDDIVSLWSALKKSGSQLGGQSGARFLRMVGKDTFLLTDDVIAVLRSNDVIQKMPTSQKDLRSCQNAFNQWRKESGRPLAHVSRILSYTAG